MKSREQSTFWAWYLLTNEGLGPPRSLAWGNMIIYFKWPIDIKRLIWGNKGYLLLKGTLWKTFREQWKLLIGNKGAKLDFSRDEGNVLPRFSFPHYLGGHPSSHYLGGPHKCRFVLKQRSGIFLWKNIAKVKMRKKVLFTSS